MESKGTKLNTTRFQVVCESCKHEWEETAYTTLYLGPCPKCGCVNVTLVEAENG